MIEYRLFFQRRSGGHALVEWIASHFETPGVLVNSLRPNVKWNLPPTKYWNMRYPVAYKNMMGFPVENVAADEDELRKREKGNLIFDHTFVITTYEDPLRYSDTLNKAKIDGVNSRTIIPIYIYRDVYNHIISRLQFDLKRKKSQPPGWYDDCIDHWKILTTDPSFDCFDLNYNKWFKLKTKRMRIGKILGFPNNDGRLNLTMPNFGGGSSFTGVKEKANYEQITNRWRGWIKKFGIKGKFKQVLDDDVLREINLKKFGWALSKKGKLIT